jgi:hypothetical protein
MYLSLGKRPQGFLGKADLSPFQNFPTGPISTEFLMATIRIIVPEYRTVNRYFFHKDLHFVPTALGITFQGC